ASQSYYTYNLYDKQNRVIETGEVDLSCTKVYVDVGYEEEVGSDTVSYFPFNRNCYYTYHENGTAMVSSHPPIVYHVAQHSHEAVMQYVRERNRKDVILTVYDTAT